MAPLFQRADGSPMQFYLTNLTDEILRNFTDLIESNGGKVEKTMNEDEYLTFTVPSECYIFRFVFDVLFFLHCVKYNTLVDIDQYYIGDSRLKTQKDRIFRLLMGNSTIVKMENLSTNESLSDITNLSTKPSTSICQKEVRIVLNRLKPSQLKNPSSSVLKFETHWTKTELIKLEEENKDTFGETHSSQSECNPRFTDEEYLPNVSGSSDTEPQVSDMDMKEEYSSSEPSTSRAIKSLKKNTICERRTNIIEPSDSESEISEIDNIRAYLDDNPWISTKKQNSGNNSSSNEDLYYEPRTSKGNIELKKNTISIEPTEELVQWAQEVTKDMKKDEFGYPEGSISKYFEKWEVDMMIAFIIRTGRFDLCKGSRLWRLACNLKILPKRRTYASLIYEYRTHILTNIEHFKLPPEIEDKFIKTRQFNSKFQRVSKDLKAWAEEVTANMKKDEFGYPEDKSKSYTWESKMMMIDFLIKSRMIKEACLYSTWEFACTLKIFPHHRTPRALFQIFRTQVLLEIKKYNLPKEIEAQFLKLKQFASRTSVEPSEDLKAWATKMRMPFTKKRKGKSAKEWRKKLMVEYLIKTDQIENYNSLETWKCFKELKLCSESTPCNYLAREFRSEVLPGIQYLDLPKEIVDRFGNEKKYKSYTDVEISEEVEIWAAEVSKGRKKDEFGYPIELKIAIQPWETVLMVDFVRKLRRIDLAKAPNFWKLAVKLKFLPKKRSIFTLANQYRYRILPNIERFKLPPEEEAEFISSRTLADIKICNERGNNGKRSYKRNELDILIS